MIQAIGLTGRPSEGEGPTVDDVTFAAPPGCVTALLGGGGAGKTHTLRLMLRLAPGMGVALFRGRPLHRIPYPAREVGVLLDGRFAGHPGRAARSHLRMLAATVGVPATRADELLDVVGLADVAGHRLGACSRGMCRRLGLAAALLGDPHTLVLDDPARDLSEREKAWLRGLLRGFAEEGGTVLATTDDVQEAAALADRVVTLDNGRLLADQSVETFVQTRLCSRVSVRSPQAERLATVLTGEHASPDARHHDASGQLRTVVRQTGGNRLDIYGSSCATVGETAHRYGIPLHRLAVETVEEPVGAHHGHGTSRAAPAACLPTPSAPSDGTQVTCRTRVPALLPRGVRQPGRYELRRLTTVRTGWFVGGLAVLSTWIAALALGRFGQGLDWRMLVGWPDVLPLPPIALAAGLLGALAYREERHYPSLHPAYAAAVRRPRLMLAKALVNAAFVVLLCGACTAGVLLATFLARLGAAVPELPADWWASVAGVAALSVGCCWCALLVAACCRSAVAGGLGVAVLSVAVGLGQVSREVSVAGQAAGGVLERFVTAALPRWRTPPGEWPVSVARFADGPLPQVVILSLAVLLCVWGWVIRRGHLRWAGRSPGELTCRQRSLSPQLRAVDGKPTVEISSNSHAVR